MEHLADGVSKFGAAEIRVETLNDTDMSEVAYEKQVRSLVDPGFVYMQRLREYPEARHSELENWNELIFAPKGSQQQRGRIESAMQEL